jgi:hypothetical protein
MPPLSSESSPSNGSTQKVSLGCGTLILIALIVLIFSNGGGNKDTARQLQEVKAELASLKQEIALLRRSIEAGQPPR